MPATSASFPRVSFFFSFLFLLLQPLTVLTKQTRQMVRAVKQSIFLDVYVANTLAYFGTQIITPVKSFIAQEKLVRAWKGSRCLTCVSKIYGEENFSENFNIFSKKIQSSAEKTHTLNFQLKTLFFRHHIMTPYGLFTRQISGHDFASS